MNRTTAGILAALMAVLLSVPAGAQKKSDADAMFEAARQKETLEGDISGAIKQYKAIAEKYKNDRAVTAMALVRMAECYQTLGDAQSGKIFDQVLRGYGDQKDAVTIARAQVGGGSTRETTDEIFNGESSFYRSSPDGRYLADSNRGLRLHEVSSNTDRQLTTGPFVSTPCFTPDSRRIVYQWAKDGRREIRIINVDGTGERTILNSSEYAFMEISAITRDGKTASVGLKRADNTWQVGLISLDTGKITPLKNNDWRETYVGNFSPDGHWLVYQAQVSKDDAQSGAVYTVATDGSAQFALTPGTAANDFPFFTPDGSRVVFAVQRTDRRDLWSVRVADGKPVGEPAIAKADIGDVMGFARDGSFYYRKLTVRASIYVAEVDPATWKLKSARNKISNAFLHDDAWDPAWSPDGKVLAYRSRWDNKIVLHRFDGTPDREMSPLVGYSDLLGWTPDGKSLVVVGAGEGLRLFDLETQSERTILDVPQGLAFLSATDGKAVFYITRDSWPLEGDQVPPTDTIRLMRHDLQTGAERELYHTEAWKGRFLHLKLSPDGRSLALVKIDVPDGKSQSTSHSFSLWLLPVSGGEPRELLPSVDLTDVYWTQDSKALLFVRSGESSGEIWVQPVDGSEAYGTGIRFEGMPNLSVHPDGSRIAFRERTERGGQVSAVRNLFSKTSATK